MMMEPQEEKKGNRGVLTAAGVLVAAVVVWYGVIGSPARDNGAAQNAGSSLPSDDTLDLIDLNARLRFSPIVPASAALTPPAEVFVSEGGDGATLNSFRIVARNGAFEPSTIVAGAGENMQISFTAVDRDYDMAVAAPIGAYVVAKAGETQYFGFSVAQEGTYTFMCYRLCPEGRRADGTIVILKKN